MITITRADCDRVLDELVAEAGPEFVFQDDCRNIDDNNNGACLIGRMLIRLGIKAEDFRSANLEGSSIEPVVVHFTAAGILRLEDDGQLLRYLQMIQDEQDSRIPWSRCLTEAREECPA